MPVRAGVSTSPAIASITAEDFAVLVAERDALAGVLRVTTAEREAEALAPMDRTSPAEIDDEASTPVVGPVRKKRGRKPPNPALPRVLVRRELPETERARVHDGHALVEIGAQVSERMDVIPEQVRVRQHHCIKYACPCCDRGLKVSPVPARIIPRGLLIEAAQAWVITGKYPFGMPLYRTAALRRRFGGAPAATSRATPWPRASCASDRPCSR